MCASKAATLEVPCIWRAGMGPSGTTARKEETFNKYFRRDMIMLVNEINRTTNRKARFIVAAEM
jgi:hypothetical protein